MAFIAQGDECIVLYLNKGNLNFEKKTLLRFPLVFGSSYFDVVDMNNDGRFVILYTCSDNQCRFKYLINFGASDYVAELCGVKNSSK